MLRTGIVVALARSTASAVMVRQNYFECGQARAFPLAKVRGPNPVEDKIAGVPVALATGPDGGSVRVFRPQWNGLDIELYRDTQSPEWRLLDSQGNTWNFAGCATSGPAAGQCLEKINF